MYLHTVIGIKDFCKYATYFTLLFISGQRIKTNKILICLPKLTLKIFISITCFNQKLHIHVKTSGMILY